MSVKNSSVAVASTVARKSVVNAKDIIVALMCNGMEGVTSLFNSKGFTVATLDSAIDTLSGTEHGSTLASFRDANFAKSNGVRGRKAAAIGDVRRYSVQEVNDTGVFIKLPVELLGLVKGDDAEVTFCDGRIVVRAAKSA
jgi:hypothetical protein